MIPMLILLLMMSELAAEDSNFCEHLSRTLQPTDLLVSYGSIIDQSLAAIQRICEFLLGCEEKCPNPLTPLEGSCVVCSSLFISESTFAEIAPMTALVDEKILEHVRVKIGREESGLRIDLGDPASCDGASVEPVCAVTRLFDSCKAQAGWRRMRGINCTIRDRCEGKHDSCGSKEHAMEPLESIQARIVNGYPTSILDHPWLSSLIMSKVRDGETGTFQCAGSFIARNLIITAAHCAAKGTLIDGYVTYGSIKNNGPSMVYVQPDNVILHPNPDVDVALIVLDGSVPSFTDNFDVIKFGSEFTAEQGDWVTVTGWGIQCSNKDCDEQNTTTQRSHSVRIKVTGREMCTRRSEPIHPWEFCAGGVHNEMPKDACEGDSGGPLECSLQNGERVLCGMVSKGVKRPFCGFYSGVYINVSHPEVLDFIHTTMQANPPQGRDVLETVISKSFGDLVSTANTLISTIVASSLLTVIA